MVKTVKFLFCTSKHNNPVLTVLTQGENITIYGDGSQTRSFCYVDDQVWLPWVTNIYAVNTNCMHPHQLKSLTANICVFVQTTTRTAWTKILRKRNDTLNSCFGNIGRGIVKSHGPDQNSRACQHRKPTRVHNQATGRKVMNAEVCLALKWDCICGSWHTPHHIHTLTHTHTHTHTHTPQQHHNHHLSNPSTYHYPHARACYLVVWVFTWYMVYAGRTDCGADSIE